MVSYQIVRYTSIGVFMKNLKPHLLLFIVILTCGCASSVVAPVKWSLQEEGIILRLYADNKLHSEVGNVKPLNFIIYQLTTPGSFDKLAESKTGLYKMLKCKKFDQSVAAVKKIKIAPGSQSIYKIDRAEGVSHIGVIAGYNAMDRNKVTRIFDVPVYVKKKSPFSSARKLVPGKLNFRLIIGSDKIEGKFKLAAHKGVENR